MVHCRSSGYEALVLYNVIKGKSATSVNIAKFRQYSRYFLYFVYPTIKFEAEWNCSEERGWYLFH